MHRAAATAGGKSGCSRALMARQVIATEHSARRKPHVLSPCFSEMVAETFSIRRQISRGFARCPARPQVDRAFRHARRS